MTAATPAAGDGQATNQQRAERLWWNAQSQLPISGIEAVRDALDAAEARVRAESWAEMAAKIEALPALSSDYSHEFRSGYEHALKRFRRVLAADAAPAGQDEPEQRAEEAAYIAETAAPHRWQSIAATAALLRGPQDETGRAGR